jgi:prepilin-type N-terminal cleavage/methylation domain-containing protein
MKKNGFTLIELIAAILIMGLLVLMFVPAIIDIRDDYLEKTRISRYRIIRNAALDWANDNLVLIPSYVPDTCSSETSCSGNCSSACACILVGELINRGYLVGSDENKTVMTNPVTNESLNNELACVRYDNNQILTRKLVAVFGE